MATLKVTITGYNNVWKQDTIRYLRSKISNNAALPVQVFPIDSMLNINNLQK